VRQKTGFDGVEFPPQKGILPLAWWGGFGPVNSSLPLVEAGFSRGSVLESLERAGLNNCWSGAGTHRKKEVKSRWVSPGPRSILY